MVLDVMFPELTQKEMETLDVTQFAQLLASRQAALEQRQMNLNISAMSRTTTTTTTTTTTLSTTTTTTTTTIANEGKISLISFGFKQCSTSMIFRGQ